MAKVETKKYKPLKTDWKKSLALMAGFVLLAVAGYFVLKGSRSEGRLGFVLSIGFILLWLSLDVFCVRSRQWLPLLATGLYWLTTSLVGLFVGEVSSQGIADFIQTVAKFAKTPLDGLNQVFGDVGLLAMAALTMVSLIGLIMILDQNKPNLSGKSDKTGTDSSDWF